MFRFIKYIFYWFQHSHVLYVTFAAYFHKQHLYVVTSRPFTPVTRTKWKHNYATSLFANTRGLKVKRIISCHYVLRSIRD